MIHRPGKDGPPEVGRGGVCSRRGACPAGCTPHFLFGLARKENGPCTVQKKRAPGALRCSGPPRDGGRRIGASADFAWPSGTLCSSAIPVVTDPWRMVRRLSGWLSYCLCFSFRCRSRSRAGEPAAAKIGAGCIPVLPRAKGLPKGSAFPSLTAARDSQPSPAGGRRSALAQTDPPNIFSFPPGAAHFLFDVSKRKWGAHCSAINIAAIPPAKRLALCGPARAPAHLPAAGTSAPPSPPPGGPPLPPPPAGKIFLNSQILHRYPLYKRSALRYDNSVSTRRI